MDIVIIANFCMDFTDKDNGRFSYLAKLLSNENDVEIITSDFYHVTKNKRESIPKCPYKVTALVEPGYPKNICMRRFYSHFVWGKNVGNYLRKRKKPDIVYCAIPSLTAAREAAKFCKKNQIPFVIDIQDLWPEAFQMVIHTPLMSNILFFPFKLLANSIYSSADGICAVSKGYLDRALAINNNNPQTAIVYLGTDLDSFDSNINEKKDKRNNDKLTIGYTGTLGKSYDIPCVIDALALLERRGDPVPNFLVIGDGPLMECFEMYAKRKGVNATFVGRLQYNQMANLLATCDFVVNPIIKGSAATIINKHADYAAAGMPVLNTQESEEYRALINEYNMGLNCINGDASDLANNITKLSKEYKLRKKMSINARRCAEEVFDRKNSYTQILSLIEIVMKG